MKRRSSTNLDVVLPILWFGLLLSCNAGPKQSDEAVFDAVLEEAAQRLDLETPIAVHPLKGKLAERGRLGAFRMSDLYAEDSVPSITLHPDRYVACALAASGACSMKPGAASLVLSEAQDLGNGAVMIAIFVSDLRGEGRVQTYYVARARRNRGRWTVYRFDRM